MTKENMKQRKHAEIIRAYADGAAVQFLSSDGSWCDVSNPCFMDGDVYRVKPEKVYPETRIGHSELFDIYAEHLRERCGYTTVGAESSGLAEVANAAIRHAIESRQVIDIQEHAAALVQLGESLRDVEIARHAGRDRAIAIAMRTACERVAGVTIPMNPETVIRSVP